ncbi:hypothetical protein LINPERPRIM_LOCUS19155, partial [Linum perenne]
IYEIYIYRLYVSFISILFVCLFSPGVNWFYLTLFGCMHKRIPYLPSLKRVIVKRKQVNQWLI